MKSPTLRERFRAVLAQLEATDSRLSQLLVMISYVNYCRTPVSMDMILAYLKGQYSDFQEIYDLLRTLGQMVAEHTGTSVIQDQDYYVPRSMLLGTAVMDNCSSDLLREVITNFHKNVSPYRIVEFSTFKRNAFDNGIMIRAFRDEAEGLSFYEEVLASDNSPYTYQHAALYASKMKNFQMAFEWINKALTLSGNRIWSIRNSYAVILFNANFRHFDDAVGRESLRESMAILKACYTADRRKPYHAATYAKQALRLWREYRAQEAWTYLELALSWLQEERVRVPWNWEVRNLLPQVREALDRR
jgi:tetratricopeptide (TPR) repeat protein